jgi:hypothetical protein
MSRSTLKFLAVLLSALILVVVFAGLDNLPRAVRAEIAGERTALAAAQKRLSSTKEAVAREVQGDPALFGAIAESKRWPDQFGQAESQLSAAARQMDELARLEKANRRQDQDRVRGLIAQERSLRSSAESQAFAIQKDAAEWVQRKRQIPEGLATMERDYNAIHAFDLAPMAAAVGKAEADWPDKKQDLETRLDGLRSIVTRSEVAWQSSAAARQTANAGDYNHLDIPALFAAEDSLKTGATDLPAKATELRALSGQLYDSWDKLLVDMETRGSGSARRYEQKLRTVRTHLANPSDRNGTATSDEQWTEVPQSTYQAMRNDLGMAIEHKPAGKYDFEADRVAQPPGFAYMAPPSQGSNQYGYWDNRGGSSFWVWYGQYALLRDLLFNRSYRPIDRYDWDGYRGSSQRGQTYYGRDEQVGGAPRYGSQGTATQERYSGSSYARSGGFRDSQYASKSGSYRNSPFSSPAARTPGGSSEGKRFGQAAPPSRSYQPPPRPSPRPSFRPPSVGRRFGKR